MGKIDSLHGVIQNLNEVQLNRRKLVQRAGLLAFSVTGIASLLTACGDDEAPADATDDEVEDEPDTATED